MTKVFTVTIRKSRGKTDVCVTKLDYFSTSQGLPGINLLNTIFEGIMLLRQLHCHVSQVRVDAAFVGSAKGGVVGMHGINASVA